MDLIKQNKFISAVVAILVVLNLLTLSIIWFRPDKPAAPDLKYSRNSPGGSAKLIAKEVSLTADQIKKFEEMQTFYRKSTKTLNDDMENLKLEIADEIFKPVPNKKIADSLASRIGSLQSEIEILRFEHFSDFVKICNAEQKGKLYPVIREVYGRRPQKSKLDTEPQKIIKNEKEGRNNDPSPGRDEVTGLVEKGLDENKNFESGLHKRDDMPGPPSVEEKLDKYARRLDLTSFQVRTVKEILQNSHAKGDLLKSQFRPAQPEFEQEKNRIRKEEDESILQILNPEQRKEFQKMLLNRQKK